MCAQIPIFELRTDGRDNVLGALLVAANYLIPEVTVYFGHKLLRGNRCSKISSVVRPRRLFLSHVHCIVLC